MARAHRHCTMITAPNSYKVNCDAIKILSKILRNPLAPSINAWAALKEFGDLLNEQIKLVENKIRIMKEAKRDVLKCASGLITKALRTGDLYIWETYEIVARRLPILTRKIRNCKRYLARLKAMNANTNRKLRILTLMSASHPRANQVSPIGNLKHDLLVKIALLSLS